MINPSNILTVFTYDGSTYTDVTQQASDFRSDDFTFDLSPTKFIYVGYNKPINALYWYLKDGHNTVDTKLKLEYYDGTTWQSLVISDQTKCLKQNGMVNWSVPTTATATTVNSVELYWYRFSTLAPTTNNLKFQYLGVTFSDDTDIALEFPSLLQDAYYPTGYNDFFVFHVNSKEYIMNELLRRGYTKDINGSKEPINQWDVLDIYELRQSALYYAMSQIFFNLSDNSSDNYWQKYLEYKAKFEQSLNVGMLRIDQDNDGQADASEKLPTASYRWVR